MDKNQQRNVDVIHIGNDRTAEMLVPSLDAQQELCVIPKEIAAHLVQLMPKGTIEQAITLFSEKAGNVKDEEGWVELLRRELNFHASMRMLQEYFAPVDIRETVAQ